MHHTPVEKAKPFPCPCCGCLTFPVPPEEALAYICPVCFWENDVFLQFPEEPSDENHGLTLLEAYANYRQYGAVLPQLAIYTRKPRPEELPHEKDADC